MTEDTTPRIRDILEDQGYHLVGKHSAVKTCHWTRKGVRDEGQCYKNTFYGIASHRCIQMTPLVTDCTQGCLFCWRDQKWDTHPSQGEGVLDRTVSEGDGQGSDSEPEEWDDPVTIADGTLEAHRDLMIGYKGSPEVVPRNLLDEALDPKHVALSLSGEPPLYPELPALLEEFHSRGLTTFLVTNGTRPDAVRRADPTQLYLSLDATDEQSYRELCRPRENGLWEKVQESLDVLSEKEGRTAIRITLVEGLTDSPAEFAPLIERAAPDFVEVKAYMHIGHSMERLERHRMPAHDDVAAFTRELADHLSGYTFADEVECSRVALLARDGAETGYLERADDS